MNAYVKLERSLSSLHELEMAKKLRYEPSYYFEELLDGFRTEIIDNLNNFKNKRNNGELVDSYFSILIGKANVVKEKYLSKQWPFILLPNNIAEYSDWVPDCPCP